MERKAFEFLCEVFPHKTAEQIQVTISTVEQEHPSDSPEQKMENMYNMLFEDAFPEEPQNNLLNEEDDDFFQVIQDDDFECLEDEGAVVFHSSTPQNTNILGYSYNNTILNNYFEQLKNIFPKASEEYLWDFCNKHSNFDFDEAVEELIRDGYDCKVIDASVIWNRLKEVLPLADPSYLEKKAIELAMEGPEELEHFVSLAIEKNDFPTMEEYLKRNEEEDPLNIFKQDHNITEFIQKFINIFPNPETHFNDPNYQNPLQQDNLPEEDILYAKAFLYNKYPYIRKRHVDLVFKIRKGCLIKCCDYLDSQIKGMKKARPEEIMPDCSNLELLQEVAYVKHKELIHKYIKHKDEVYQECKEHARALGLLETCDTCTENQLLYEVNGNKVQEKAHRELDNIEMKI